MRGLIFTLIFLLWSMAQAAEPALEIEIGGKSRSFARDVLLSMPNTATIDVPKDVSYGTTMTYRAVPVASLLAGFALPPDSVIEAVAVDGFTAQLPIDLMLNTDPQKAPWAGLPSSPPTSLGPSSRARL
jgi:hypothetical protein